jgi:hypothetical protein
MRHRRWLLDERLDSSATNGQPEKLRRLAHPLCSLDIPSDVKSDHPTELVSHKPHGALVMRMARESRIEHPSDGSMILEPLGDGQGGFGLLADSQLHGLDPAMEQKGLEPSDDPTGGILDEVQLPMQLRRFGG